MTSGSKASTGASTRPRASEAKALVALERARRDAESAVRHYTGEAGKGIARRFSRALKVAFVHIQRHPGTGSSRHGNEAGIADVRSWRVKGFPYLVFYRDLPDRVEVWRVLHGARDIPSSLREPDDG